MGAAAPGVAQSAEEVLAAYGDMVLRTAYTMVKNRADAEDIAQDVFLALVRTNPSFESAEHQKAWLLRVTMNRCNSFLRSAWQQKTQGIEDAFPDQAFTPEESGVMDAVNDLPEKYRQAIYLYYIQGYDTAEIAGLLHRPQNTVLSQLSRARKMLRETLGGGFEDA